MALRPDSEDPDLMDDIVVERPAMFRAEAMSDDLWWLACYFDNGERVTFHVRALARPQRIEFSVGETPPEWLDWDELRSPPSTSEGGR
jgi:hypothetical protein